MRVMGLVAAAGASRRMGSPKALLPWDFDDDGGHVGDRFVTHLVAAMLGGGVDTVTVTVPDDDDTASAIADLVGDHAVCVRNPLPAQGLTGSIIAALDAGGHDVDVLVLCPVDVPFATPALVRALIATVINGAEAAVVAVDGVRGHPVAFGRGVFEALRRAGDAGGPRQVLAMLTRVVEVAAADRRLVVDVNTMADLDRVRQMSE